MISNYIQVHNSCLHLSDEQFEQAKVLNSSIEQYAMVVFDYGS